eukprot:scaffold643_cov45-Phaeocystis_antarctica.AAC.2
MAWSGLGLGLGSGLGSGSGLGLGLGLGSGSARLAPVDGVREALPLGRARARVRLRVRARARLGAGLGPGLESGARVGARVGVRVRGEVRVRSARRYLGKAHGLPVAVSVLPPRVPSRGSPVQGEAQTREQQTCPGPCVLVRGSSPLWHTGRRGGRAGRPAAARSGSDATTAPGKGATTNPDPNPNPQAPRLHRLGPVGLLELGDGVSGERAVRTVVQLVVLDHRHVDQVELLVGGRARVSG